MVDNLILRLMGHLLIPQLQVSRRTLGSYTEP